MVETEFDNATTLRELIEKLQELGLKKGISRMRFGEDLTIVEWE